MRKLKIGFSKNRNNAIFSVLIQKYYNRNYSHVFVQYDVKRILGDKAIYHSSLSSGIGYSSKKVFEEKNKIVKMYEIDISSEIYDKVKKELFKVCGRKYGMAQNIGILIVDFFKMFKVNIKNPLVENENCSEMVYRHVIQTIREDYNYDPNTITPSDIEDILKKIAVRIQ